jgi:hypothetical protein
VTGGTLVPPVLWYDSPVPLDGELGVAFALLAPVAQGQDYACGPLGTGMDDMIYALTIYNGDLIASGKFATAGGASCMGTARWDGTTWRSPSPQEGEEPHLAQGVRIRRADGCGS